MTDRYTLTQPWKMQERFQTANQAVRLEALYNQRSGQTAITVSRTRQGVNALVERYYGFLPPWAVKDAENRMAFQIMARAESVHEKPMWANAFQRNRCLLIADGCYLWHKHDETEEPYYLRLKTRELFAIAAVASLNLQFHPTIETFATLSVRANGLVAEIHERMPMILHRDAEAVYLDPSTPEDALRDVLVPYDETAMELYKVTPKLKHATGNSRKLIDPIAGALQQQSWLDSF